MGSIEDRYAYDQWHADREEKLNSMDDTFQMPRNTGAYPSWEPPRDNQSTAIKQVQQPELSLSAEVEPFAKGGWKTTIRASVRVFDGNATAMYDQLAEMITSGLAIADGAIKNHEAMKETPTNE